MTPWSCPSSGRPRTSAGRIQKRSETDDRNSEGIRNAVRTESEAFNKAYSIRGNDGHSIFYLLTPHYMEKLLALSYEIGKRLAMQFRRDGKLLLCISGLDLFEVKEAGSAAELQKQIEGEMNFLGKILETLEVPT